MGSLLDIVKKKNKKVIEAKAPFVDMNRGIILTLLAVDVIGKDARDEEVVELILSEGMNLSQDDKFTKGLAEDFKKQQELYGKGLKLDKKLGHYINPLGQVVFRPKNLKV